MKQLVLKFLQIYSKNRIYDHFSEMFDKINAIPTRGCLKSQNPLTAKCPKIFAKFAKSLIPICYLCVLCASLSVPAFAEASADKALRLKKTFETASKPFSDLYRGLFI
jgi:hypothetical protein